MSKQKVGELMEKYKQQIKAQMGVNIEKSNKIIYSKEYQNFKEEYLPRHLSYYEKACNIFEKLVKVSPDPKKEEKLNKAIQTCHLNITPTGATSFALMMPILIIFFGAIISYLVFQSFFFIFFFFIVGAALIGPFNKLTFFLANKWRMKASNQMVLCIFYVVTYMRHTSNLENAIEFAAEHLSPPLALDLKKVIWDVETEEFSSIKESLDNYLEQWREDNNEFVGAFELIESSLYEGSEARRLSVLDKSLDVILSETYEKMLHYAHGLKSPITMLHMLGIIMPILGLVILPLIVSFFSEAEWYHIAALYNILIPISVYYMGKIILAKRPTGYGDTDITLINPDLKKYKSIILKIFTLEIKIHPLFISIMVFIILFLIGLSPIIIHMIDEDFDIVIIDSKDGFIQYKKDVEKDNLKNVQYSLLDYKMSTVKENTSSKYGKIIGPFGIGASIFSVFIVLSIGLSIGLYYRLRSKNIIAIREKSKQLEKEFASALFQLGNRLGDGLPAELAFGKVAIVMKDSISGNFFELVSQNIRKLGMGVKQAIFDSKSGAILAFPSKIIESSMKVLIQSVKKGPAVAAQSLMNISRYIKEIHTVDERLKDLLGEIISSMKSQIKFLTPVIAGIVIGITSMISTILGKLGLMLSEAASGDAAMELPELFGDGIPTYYFMIVVGIYVVQIVYILTILGNGIENGEDKLNENYLLGQNLIKSTLLFSFFSVVIMIIFNIIATVIITQVGI
ncbi:MAG: hypothetical protein ABII01_01045 [Candidatus Woesearchaeota archaeon]